MISEVESLSSQLLPQSAILRGRYSITSCWCRLTQPAKISIKNCSGKAFNSPSLGQRWPIESAEVANLVIA